MGIEKIEPYAGIGHHHIEQLPADTLPATLFADIEMADATGAAAG